MGESVVQRCGSCKQSKPPEAFSLSYRGKPGTWCKPCFAAYNRGESTFVPHDPLTCIQCGEQYVPQTLNKTRNGHKYCSRACKDRAGNVRWAADNGAKKPAIRTCVSCGGDMPRAKRSDAKYCTDQCGDATRGAARYATTRGAQAIESFTLDEIFERDGGWCYLCRLSCSRGEASMDHVVPVSPPHHGSHTRANVKLAHLACNSRKSNRLLSELAWYVPAV